MCIGDARAHASIACNSEPMLSRCTQLLTDNKRPVTVINDEGKCGRDSLRALLSPSSERGQPGTGRESGNARGGSGNAQGRVPASPATWRGAAPSCRPFKLIPSLRSDPAPLSPTWCSPLLSSPPLLASASLQQSRSRPPPARTAAGRDWLRAVKTERGTGDGE